MLGQPTLQEFDVFIDHGRILEDPLLQFLDALDEFSVFRLVLLDARETIFEHQSLLVAEMPDRAVDQLFQSRREIFR